MSSIPPQCIHSCDEVACASSVKSSIPEWGSAVSVLCLSGLVTIVSPTSGLAAPPSIAPQPATTIAQLPENLSQYAVLFVNSTTGNDRNTGGEQAPLKTITQALKIVQPNTIILLSPGTYSAETGETFPLQLKPGTTLKGEPRDRGQGVIIQGGGFFLSRTFARQNVTIVGANQAGLTGVTVTNAHPQGYGLWVESTSPVITDNTFTGSGHDGASVVGSSAPILRNNYFYQNGANGITIYGTSRPELQDNIFEKTGFGINIAQNSAPRLTGNRVTQNKDGIVIQGKARPILRNNVVDGNDRDGMVAIAQARPNLGTANDPGNNTFAGNAQFDINAKTSSETIVAFGNQLASNKANGKLDFAGTTMMGAADIPVAPPTSGAAAVPFGQELPRLRSPQALKSPQAPATTGSLDTIPVSRLVSPPTAQRTPIFSRPAATSLRRLPLSKETAAQIQLAPPMAAAAPLMSATPRVALGNRSSNSSGAIEIPVPAPESGTIAAAPMAPPLTTAAIASPDILPVPGADAPIGNVGGMSSVPVWRNPTQQAAGSPPIPPSRSVALALRYRVVVVAEDEGQQAQVKAIVPDAFLVSLRGRTLLQAGAFGDRSKADELLQSLLNQGLKATIEQL
ncbi:MAG: DUF1565 domain-containing protein [Leptolyngbyaceae cyanobacterium CSU_1_3]|nr:DUF1565 domain-containing protein [Leptolyngbyaceae cyanobacterium CSU_1_3]